MEPMNVSRKRLYADFSGQPVVTMFKNFDDLELWDVDRLWSIVVRVDVKFHVEDHGNLQRFILMDTTGSKIEAISRDSVDTLNMLLNEGHSYTIHRVQFQPNYGEVEFRSIGNPFECVFTRKTSVEPYNVPIQFPQYPKHLMSFTEVYHRPNKTFVDIAGIAVHWGQLEHFGPNLYREVTLMDTRFNLLIVGIWCQHLTRHAACWESACAGKHIVLGTMLKKNYRHGCLETSDHTTFSFNPSHHETRDLETLRRSLVMGVVDLTFVTRFVENRWAYLATVV